MTFNMNVIAEFEARTGKDFNHVAISAINAYRNSEKCGTLSERAEVLTKAISRADAAWLFYIASKESDKLVTFEEIQEAVMLEGFIYREDESGVQHASYPIRFIEAVSFATVGILDKLKKKNQKE